MLKKIKSLYKNKAIRLAILVIVLTAVFGYSGGRFYIVKAYNSRVNIFPGSFTIEQIDNGLVWENIGSSFFQDLAADAEFNEFNMNNAAYIISSSSVAGRQVESPAAGESNNDGETGIEVLGASSQDTADLPDPLPSPSQSDSGQAEQGEESELKIDNESSHAEDSEDKEEGTTKEESELKIKQEPEGEEKSEEEETVVEEKATEAVLEEAEPVKENDEFSIFDKLRKGFGNLISQVQKLELFDFKLKYVIYYYLIGHLLYAMTVAWGCQYLNKIGLRRSLRISVVVGAFYYSVFYLLDQKVINENLLLIFTIILITFHRIMYWIPMHTDIAKFTSKKDRAKQLSLMEATTLVLGATMPLVAGWILMQHSYDILFLLAVVIYLMSLIPLAMLPKTKERFSWSYKRTWKEFLSNKRKRTVLAYMGDGAEAVVGVIIWPIFIWELLQGNYFEVGALSSLIVSVTIVLQL